LRERCGLERLLEVERLDIRSESPNTLTLTLTVAQHIVL